MNAGSRRCNATGSHVVMANVHRFDHSMHLDNDDKWLEDEDYPILQSVNTLLLSFIYFHNKGNLIYQILFMKL